VLKEPFQGDAKYIKEVFLQNPADFQSPDIPYNLPFLVELKELERLTKAKICKDSCNNIYGEKGVKKHPDSGEHMFMLLNKLALKHEESFKRETLEKYFRNANLKDKSIAKVKSNIERIKSKINEYEREGKKPGGSHIMDMLRATIKYDKANLDGMLLNID